MGRVYSCSSLGFDKLSPNGELGCFPASLGFDRLSPNGELCSPRQPRAYLPVRLVGPEHVEGSLSKGVFLHHWASTGSARTVNSDILLQPWASTGSARTVNSDILLHPWASTGSARTGNYDHLVSPEPTSPFALSLSKGASRSPRRPQAYLPVRLVGPEHVEGSLSKGVFQQITGLRQAQPERGIRMFS